MDDWGQFFQEIFDGLIKLIMDLICGICKGVFYGFKKLRNKKFLVGGHH